MNSKLSLNWDLYQNSICNGFSSLQQLGEFVDMTLAADGHFVKVHQTLIALASPYLRALIKSVPTQHPVVFLDNVDQPTLCYILEYIYTGEVTVPKEKLQLFTRAARNLCLTGIENILEKNKEFQLMQIDAEYYDSDYDPEEEITNTIKIEQLPTELVPQNNYESEEEQTNDDYFQPHADTIKIDVESELNIPYNTENRDIFNNSTDNFENTLRQIPTPLLTPSGNNLSSFVNLKSPMPHLNVTPHDFNCDSNSSFHMDQFLKGLNPTNGENAQDIQNSATDLTNGQPEVYNFTVEPISQKSMPMIDITNSKGFTLPNKRTEEQYPDQGYKSFKRLLTEDSIPYHETNQSGGFKKLKSMDDDNSICFSPLLNLINNDDINVDNVAEEDSIPTETDNSNAIEELMSMPILDASPESTEVAKDWQVQSASQIEIRNTGELFVRPQNPGKIKSLRYHRRNKSKVSSNSLIPSISKTCNIDEPIIALGKSMADHTQQQLEEPIIELHIPETEENMELTDLPLATDVPMPEIEIKLPPKKPPTPIVKKMQTETKKPRIKIKIPDEHSSERVKTSEILKKVTDSVYKKKMDHGVQIIKIPENLTSKVKKSGDMSVESTAASGLRRIRIAKQESDISKVKVKKIKRIIIRKAPGTTKPEDKDTELSPESLGFKFKLPKSKPDTAPEKEPSKTASVIVGEPSKCEEDKDQETSVNQQAKEPKEKSPVNVPTIEITHNDKADIPAVNIRVPLRPDPNSSMVQYSVSQRGCLQIIVNRFMYRCHHSHSLKKRWRCVDYYRPERCPAYIDTDDGFIVERVNAHKHPFHDRQIWDKMRKNLVFSAITQAEASVRDQLLLRNSENGSDGDEDLDEKD